MELIIIAEVPEPENKIKSQSY